MATSLPFSALNLQTNRKCHEKLITPAHAQFPVDSLAINWSGYKEYKGIVSRSIPPKQNNWKLFCNNHPIELNDSETDSDLFHASATIEKFYKFINDKKLDEMHELIAEKCFFEELSFPHPFNTKKEVIHFLDELIEAMGKDVKFKTENIYRGGQYAVGVTWHLEWKGTEIPFTKGCSFYECSEEGGRRVIK